MPKVTKKKKEKTADFTKAKLKLGKGKKVPTNSTNTSFKARSIALPGQQPLDRALAAQVLTENGQTRSDPALPPTTSRGLTLDEVLIQLRHPNGGMRKDTLAALKEVLVVGVEKGVSMGRREGEVGKVIRALGGLVSDEDGSVRKALLGFLSWYLPLLPSATLTPHLPLLLLQTSSALSHIFPEIRLDACRLVHFLLDQVPSHVVGTWPNTVGSGPSTSKQTIDSASGAGNNILEGLRLAVGLGGEKGSSSQMGFRITPASKLVTLRALSAFISRALGQTTANSTGDLDEKEVFGVWIEDSSRAEKGPEVVRAVADLAADFKGDGWLVGNSAWSLDTNGLSDWEVGRISSGNTQDETVTQETLSQLYLTLQPLLLSTFLESAPTAFAPTPMASSSAEDVPLSLCSVTADITTTLAKAVLSSAQESALVKLVRSGVSDFLRRMAAWFPFRASRPQQSSSGISPEFNLSLSYSRIAVLLAPRPAPFAFGNGGSGRASRSRAVEAAWKAMRENQDRPSKGNDSKGKGKAGADSWALSEVSDWVVEILAPPSDALAPAMTPAAYSAILPIVWALLVQPRVAPGDLSTDIPERVGQALLRHLNRQSSNSSIKRLGNSFLYRLILLHEDRYPALPFYIPETSDVRSLVTTWSESLPKVLWELGVKDEKASESLLRFLLAVALRGNGSIEEPYSLLRIASLPVISGSKGAVPGPWTKFSSDHLKKLGLEVGRVWLEWDDGKLQAAVRSAVGQGAWKQYWDRPL